MIRIYPLGKTIKSYMKLHGDKRPNLTLTCSHCQGVVLYKHGCYPRSGTTKHQHIKIPIYRWYCPECGQTVSVLPDFLIPWARFVTAVRESAMKQRAKGKSYPRIARDVASPSVYGVSAHTIKRWWKRYLARAGDAAIWLAKQLIESGKNEDLLRRFPAGVNPTEQDTLKWLNHLINRYMDLFPPKPPVWQGSLSWMNRHLPEGKWL